MTLSDKIITTELNIPMRTDGEALNLINADDVKEFIKELKETFRPFADLREKISPELLNRELDELAGEKLI